MNRLSGVARWRRDRRRARARRRLDTVQVAKPCPARWEEMAGDEKVRFCAHCRLNVFNLSAMDVEEAANLIAAQDGRLCVRFYRRRDGTILTQDCPVGVAAWKKRLAVVWSSTAGACAGLVGGVFGWSRLNPAPRTMMGGLGPAPSVAVPAEPAGEPAMGDVASPPKNVVHVVGLRAAPIQGRVVMRR